MTQREAFSELEQYIFCLGRIIKNEEICSAQPSTAVAADNKSSTVSSKSSELDRLADNLSMMLGPRDEDSRSAGDDASGVDNGQGVSVSSDEGRALQGGPTGFSAGNGRIIYAILEIL